MFVRLFFGIARFKKMCALFNCSLLFVCVFLFPAFVNMYFLMLLVFLFLFCFMFACF